MIGGSTRRSRSRTLTAPIATLFRDVSPSGFSRRLAGYLSPNAATGLDLVFGVAAMALVLPDHWLSGVVLIQVFGIFSCADGEIARIQGRSSRSGDFLDTLTDRVISCCWSERSHGLRAACGPREFAQRGLRTSLRYAPSAETEATASASCPSRAGTRVASCVRWKVRSEARISPV